MRNASTKQNAFTNAVLIKSVCQTLCLQIQRVIYETDHFNPCFRAKFRANSENTKAERERGSDLIKSPPM